MGNWKKAVALVATVPMLMALAPAANAAEATTSAANTPAAQQALAAAVAQNGTITADDTAVAAADTPTEGPSDLANYEKDANLLANYDFNDVKADQTGTLNDKTGKAKATINGKAATATNTKDSTTALTLGSGNWLNLTNADGSALLKGKHAVTISYDSKANATGGAWTVFAAPNANGVNGSAPTYLGVLDQTNKTRVERYINGRNSDKATVDKNAGTAGNWKHVDIVVTDEFSALYVDGKQQGVSTDTADSPLTSILGAEGGVFQVGKGNWGNGEYFTGDIDNLKVYDSTAAAIADALNNADVPESVTADFTVPVSSNGTAIAWTSDNAAIAIDAATGKATVTRPASDQADVKVALTATVNGEKKTFTVTVKHEESAADKAQADLDAIDLGNLNAVYSSITLPTTGSKFGSPITWTSSDPSVISDKADGKVAPGVVTRPADGDKTVVLTASVEGATAVKRFVATVKKAVKQETTTDYLFAHFTGSERNVTDEQMYFATSEDGLKWTDTHKDGDPVLTSDVGETGVRDPYLVRSPEGDTVYLIATDLSVKHYGWHFRPGAGGSTKLVIWESHDLVSWSKPRLVDVASKIPGAGCAWAPEAYWIPEIGEYMVYWATTAYERSDPRSNDSPLANEYNDQMNMYYATTRDFVHFSDPVKWIDRNVSVIDTTMMKVGDWYYRANGDGKNSIEKSKDPFAVVDINGEAADNTNTDENQWSYVGALQDILSNPKYSGSYLEGPEFFKYNSDDIPTVNGKKMPYGLMWDQYREGKGYLPFFTSDPGSNSASDWSFASSVNFGSLKKRHGTILPITKTEYDAVMKAYNGTTLQNNYSEGAAAAKSLTVLDAANASVAGTTVKVKAGATATFSAVTSGLADGTQVSWASADPSVATVDPATGDTTTFTGVKAGTTTVTVKAGDQTVEFTLEVEKSGSEPTTKYGVEDLKAVTANYVDNGAQVTSFRYDQSGPFTIDKGRKVKLQGVPVDWKIAEITADATKGQTFTVTSPDGAFTQTYAFVFAGAETPKPNPGAGNANQGNGANAGKGGLSATGSSVAGLIGVTAMLAAAGATLTLRKRRA